jgi:hypothetical protein
LVGFIGEPIAPALGRRRRPIWGRPFHPPVSGSDESLVGRFASGLEAFPGVGFRERVSFEG